MSESENINQKIDSVVHQLIKEQLTNLSNSSNTKNNSFAYLEKGTLNLLIAYLMSGEKRKTGEIGHKEIYNKELELKIIKQLDEMLEDSKEQFEEVISLLKKMS
ncbi:MULTISPECIES: hypothetical protein [Lysinibacillus]|uniref:hypothetical protein n=1 Tax=Lysinibacillus TaxID=400634 RepID=UPI00083C9132|nr:MULTISPECIES: hypothetical protein [Lysinibacillus]